MCHNGCPADRSHGHGHCHRHHEFPERGWVQFLFLRLLHEKPMYGYQIMEELQKRRYVPAGRLESGSVYTILRRMEHRGLVKSEWEEVESGPDRRIYRITDEGVAMLKAGLEGIARRKALMDDLTDFYKKTFQGTQ